VNQQQVRNLTASIRDRLRNQARERNEEFQLILTQYAIDRLLYRLSSSPHADRFVLKGAMLVGIWGGGRYRVTRDVDLLKFGSSELDHIEKPDGPALLLLRLAARRPELLISSYQLAAGGNRAHGTVSRGLSGTVAKRRLVAAKRK